MKNTIHLATALLDMRSKSNLLIKISLALRMGSYYSPEDAVINVANELSQVYTDWYNSPNAAPSGVEVNHSIALP